MQQYSDLGKRIIEEGVWIENPRTGVKCKTVLNHTFVYDVGNREVPVITTRKVPYRGAFGEFMGYLQGKSSAADLRELGSKTWDGNANENAAWLANPNRKGEDDLGRIYGVQARSWTNQFGEHFDQLKKVIENLRNGIDDRGEVVTFWNPGEFDYGCLRPCMHTHTFSIFNGELHLTSVSRSVDVPLGLPANMMQCYFFLDLMAMLTGLNPGKVTHHMINVHVYENQYELFLEEMSRPVLESNAILWLDPHLLFAGLPGIDTLTKESVILEDYEAHPPIKYPFTV